MKKIVIAFAAAMLIAVTVFSPVAAAATHSLQSYEKCGNTYIVKSGDTLSKIAVDCGTTVSEIVRLNPEIKDPNLIYKDQVLDLTGARNAKEVKDASKSKTPSSGSSTTSEGAARVSLSSTNAKAGDKITVSIYGFPAHSSVDYRVGETDKAYSVAYDGTVDEEGHASITIQIPSDATKGENWVVVVCTTSQANGVTVTSNTIHINN